MEKISVAIRVRPPSKSSSPIPYLKGHKWNVGPQSVSLCSSLGTPVNGQSYSFDRVFGTDAKNDDIYEGLTKGVIMSSLNGFNGTVFAYGQTSSGKTHTMKGSPTDPGIIRLAVYDVFDHIRQMTNNREFLIRVSYMEIYNEEINDLFATENRRLRIHENLEKGIFVAGLREEIVDSPEQVFALLEFGESHRHFGETNMNLYSSRSHTIFRMVIESRDSSQDGCEADLSSDAVRVSCLNMVDLAGSERIAKTGAGGVRLKEGTHINKSLMTLGTVINKLSDGTGKQGGHVPYRDSKLTRILQPALGGNAKTAMICSVTPDEIHIDETRGTLQFASRAKRVSTCAQVNEIVTDAALLKRQTKEIEDLRMKLQGLPQSAHLEKEILTLRNELLKFELEKERLYLELQEEKKAQAVRERRIKEQEQKIENLSSLFINSNLDDRDVDKSHKKVNRRETWCPRPLNTEKAVKDFRKSVDEIEDDETMDNILYSMRRDRNHTLPPAFEIEEEADPFWPRSNDLEEPEPPSDFDHIADEDTWMSLNKGHTTSSTVFTPGFSGFSERDKLSTGEAQKIVLLESHLNDLQERYTELQRSCDIKIDEASEDLNENLNRVKRQLGRVQIENVNLKNELLAQLEMHKELQYVLEDLESEMNAARLQSGSMQGILTESLHVQSNVLVSIQENMTIASTMGKYTSSLSVGNSVKQCRKMCSEAQSILQGRLSQDFIAHRSTEIRQTGTNLTNTGDDINNFAVRCNIDVAGVGTPSSQVCDETVPEMTKTSSLPGESNYCEECMSSMLPSSRSSSHEDAVNSLDTNCEEDKMIETSGLMRSLSLDDGNRGAETNPSQSQEHPLDLVYDSASCIPNGLRAHALRALALHTDAGGELCACKGRTCGDHPDPTGVWTGVLSCQHVGCSFGTLLSNCEICASQERAFMGNNEIPTEVRKLCSLILKLLEPSVDKLGGAKVRHSQGREGQGTGKLKTRLASAKLLATWLWEEVVGIAGHDFDCLSFQIRERGHVGILLESLQVLLLQIASLAIGLLEATCQDEDLMKDLHLQLSKLKDEPNNSTGCVAKEMPQVDAVSATFEQGRTLPKVRHPIYGDTGDTVVQSIEGVAEDPAEFISDRVVKVEGVEEVLGGVLQNSMGEPLSPVLNSARQESADKADIFRDEEVTVTNVVGQGSPEATVNSRSTPRGSNASYPEQSQQLTLWPGDEDHTSCLPEAHQVPDVLVEPTGECCPMGILASGSHDVVAPQIRMSCDFSIRDKWKPIDFSFRENNFSVAKHSVHGPGEAIHQTNHEIAAELLPKTENARGLEIKLAEAELEIVELKIHLESMRVEMQGYGDICQKDSVQVELQAYKEKCENYKEEIRRVIEQFPRSAGNVQKGRQLTEVLEENQFLQDCLAKAKKHVLRSKAWRDEIRRWKDIENTRVVKHPLSGAVQVEQPQAVQKNEGNMRNSVSPPRAALRVLDMNSQGVDYDPHNNPKRRRQLQFVVDENFHKSDLTS